MNELDLTGMDGANPLAFFAALGVLVALDDRHEGSPAKRPRLAWRQDGVWRPVLSSVLPDLPAVVDELDADRRSASQEEVLRFHYLKRKEQKDGSETVRELADVKAPPEELHAALQRWALTARPDAHRNVDWMTAFVSEGALDRGGAAKPSALHFTAGQQFFLGIVATLAESVGPAAIREAVQGPWMNASKLPVMGWDNTAARDYALRAMDPSNDKKLGTPGADWLAIRGLLLFPTAASRQRLGTACAAGGWKTGRFTWPIWERPLSRDELRGLLLIPDLGDLPSEARLRRGIPQVFRADIRRSDQGGYGSFTPAQVL